MLDIITIIYYNIIYIILYAYGPDRQINKSYYLMIDSVCV